MSNSAEVAARDFKTVSPEAGFSRRVFSPNLMAFLFGIV
jgi:hypothetical protein